MLFHSLNGHQGQNWACPKLEVAPIRYPTWVCSPRAQASYATFEVISKELNQDGEQLVLELVPTLDAGASRQMILNLLSAASLSK